MAVAAKKSSTSSAVTPPAVVDDNAPLAPAIEKVEKAAEAAVAQTSAPILELQGSVRKALEKGVVESRAAYVKVKVAAEEASGAVEASASTAAKGLVEFNAKALDALSANAAAYFDFLKAVTGVKSVSEFMTLQTELVRKQSEALTAQAKELAALSQKVAKESAEPIRTQVAKTFKLAS
jgi:phasin